MSTTRNAWSAPERGSRPEPTDADLTVPSTAVAVGLLGGLFVCGVAALVPSPFATVPAALVAVPLAAAAAGGRVGGVVAGVCAAALAYVGALAPLVSALPATAFVATPTKDVLGTT